MFSPSAQRAHTLSSSQTGVHVHSQRHAEGTICREQKATSRANLSTYQFKETRNEKATRSTPDYIAQDQDQVLTSQRCFLLFWVIFPINRKQRTKVLFSLHPAHDVLDFQYKITTVIDRIN